MGAAVETRTDVADDDVALARRAAHESLEQMRLLVELSSDLITRHAADGEFLYVSPACRSILGYEPTELVARNWQDFVHPDDLPGVLEAERGVFQPATRPITYRTRHRDGRWIWMETTAHVIRSAVDGRPVEVHAVSRDVSERVAADAERSSLLDELAAANALLVRANRRLEQLAHFDELTGLPNRTLLTTLLDQAFGRARRSGRAVAVLFVDLDSMKAVNDRFGHGMGDELLVAFAHILRSEIRDGDIAARWGGDEFVVLSESVDGLDAAMTLGRRILDAARRPVPVGTTSASPRTSIGLCLTRGTVTPDSALRVADRLLYRVKERGGDDLLATELQ